MGAIFAGFLALVVANAQARNVVITAGGDCTDGRPGQGFFKAEKSFVDGVFGKGGVPGWEPQSCFRDDSEGTTFSKSALFPALDASYRISDEGKAVVSPQPEPHLGSGDQLLLQINTHGSYDDDPLKHGLCIDGDYMPVRHLKTALDALAARGVKVAVLDSSCYGGASVKALAGKNVCVVSGTSDTLTNAPGDVTAPMFARLALSRMSDPARKAALLNEYSDAPAKARKDGAKIADLALIYGKETTAQARAMREEVLRTYEKTYHEPLPSREAAEAMIRARSDEDDKAIFTKKGLAAIKGQPNLELGGHDPGKVSLEELYLSARLDSALDDQGRWGQISSDVDGVGFELGRRLMPLVLSTDFRANSTEAREVREKIEASFSGECSPENLLEKQVRALVASVKSLPLDSDESRKIRGALKRLGFDDLEKVRMKLAEAVKKRKALYDRLLAACDSYNQALGDGSASHASLLKLKAARDKLQDEFTLSLRDVSYGKMEKAIYAAEYIHQRAKNQDDPKVQACSQFTF